MTQTAFEAPAARRGLDDLRAALTSPDTTRTHRLWHLLEEHHPAAVAHLGHIGSPLTAALRRGPDPDRLVRQRHVHAEALLSAVQRGLVHATGTLAGLADQDPRPIQAKDATLLLYPTHVAVTRMGLVPDELTTAKLARAAVAAFAHALTSSH